MNGFDVTLRDERDWVNFGETYVASEAFRALFRDGMALVEETAAYLDGEGREDSRLISRDATLSYAAESMRLTTLLMQIASWLLVQRAVAEGEITPGQALQEKTRVKLASAGARARRGPGDAAASPAGPRDACPPPARPHPASRHADLGRPPDADDAGEPGRGAAGLAALGLPGQQH